MRERLPWPNPSEGRLSDEVILQALGYARGRAVKFAATMPAFEDREQYPVAAELAVWQAAQSWKSGRASFLVYCYQCVTNALKHEARDQAAASQRMQYAVQAYEEWAKRPSSDPHQSIMLMDLLRNLPKHLHTAIWAPETLPRWEKSIRHKTLLRQVREVLYES